jgi:hypothetical protein
VIRVRLTYSKRGRACFIPHIAIPTVLARSAARAAIGFRLSEGFTPRPKISLGPELSVGVPALAEPFEAWLTGYDEDTPRRWNLFLPEGFSITGSTVVEGLPGTEEAKSLGKWCRASSCILALRGGEPGTVLHECLEELKNEGTVLSFGRGRDLPAGFYRLVMENPAQKGPGVLVKALAARGIVAGWPDVFILREAVGSLSLREDGEEPRVLPLAEPLAAAVGEDRRA